MSPAPANRRLYAALAAYAALSLAAWSTLDGKLLWMTWIILAAFTLRTVVFALRPPQD